MPKKTIIITLVGLFLIITPILSYKIYQSYRIKNATIIVELRPTLEIEFLSEVKVSDFITDINGKILNDYTIDTTKVGSKKINFQYLNDENIKIDYSYTINIKDNTAPIIWLGSSYSVTKGSTINLLDKIMCGDNYDSNPKCEIIGEYDMLVAGTYPLEFKATDQSGNITSKKFNLYVNEPKPSNNQNNNQVTTRTRTKFADVIKKHKTASTEIGIDISEWQGTVDFNQLKDAGVEFVILRVGSTKGIEGDYFVDGKFVENIKKANEIGMPVGVYFYSYANSKEKAIKDAQWILEQIKDYQVDLPIAFDWENWSFYNEFNLSFFGLTDMANSFLDVFKKAGYEGMLYSSKTYLESIWLETDYPVWLAHYAQSTSYQGEYEYWQICSNGEVPGINGDVDINIRYK